MFVNRCEDAWKFWLLHLVEEMSLSLSFRLGKAEEK